MVDRANSFKHYHKMGKHIFYSGFQEELIIAGGELFPFVCSVFRGKSCMKELALFITINNRLHRRNIK